MTSEENGWSVTVLIQIKKDISGNFNSYIYCSAKQVKSQMDNCSICLSDVDATIDCKMVPCGHVFHPLCIQTWLSQKSECPMCRSSVSSCQHGGLVEHESYVLMGVIESQKSIIETMKTEAQVSNDTAFALQMRSEILAQDMQRHTQQYMLYNFFVNSALLHENSEYPAED